MEDLLLRASRALSHHHADTLERLAAQGQAYGSGASGVDVDVEAIRHMLQVLGLQVAAAGSHLDLRQRLTDAARVEAQTWAR